MPVPEEFWIKTNLKDEKLHVWESPSWVDLKTL